MEKSSHKIKVILYISTWVIIWGTVGSLLDLYLFLNNNIYCPGDLGQYLTFSVTAILSIFAARYTFIKLKL